MLQGASQVADRRFSVVIITVTATSRKGRLYTPIAFARAHGLLDGNMNPAEVQDGDRQLQANNNNAP